MVEKLKGKGKGKGKKQKQTCGRNAYRKAKVWNVKVSADNSKVKKEEKKHTGMTLEHPQAAFGVFKCIEVLCIQHINVPLKHSHYRLFY